jgi:hypothetical protein
MHARLGPGSDSIEIPLSLSPKENDFMNVKYAIRSLAIAAAVALPLALFTATPAKAAPVVIQIGIAPPPLPVYVQPVVPGDGYIWTPGYWAYADDGGYYWVPGTWVLAPTPGYLWTPAYWGWENGFYIFHGGYWGPHIGFYGGINYGFGYFGTGFVGGEWRGGHFFYNSAYARFGTGFHPTNVYVHNVTIVNHTTVSYNGHGGVNAQPNAQETAAMHENHVQPTAAQVSHQTFAAQNKSQFAGNNGGHPAVTAAKTPEAYHSNPTHNAGAPRPATTAANTAHPAPAPASHPAPAPASHPTPAPASHPAPAPAPHPAPASHPAPAAHPAPAPHGGENKH